jgi:formylglycine-generating enzyme required for sulfatase activity
VYRLKNMAGNVWEFTTDRYAADTYELLDRIDPAGPDRGGRRVVRGGSWRSPAFTLRVTQRASVQQNETRPDVGFRCAYDVP